MERDWDGYLVKEVILGNYTSQEILEVLGLDDEAWIVAIEVFHEKHGNMEVYVAIYDNKICLSTKSWLLE